MNTYKTKKGTELELINLKGKAYLTVAQRLIWFREERPDWSIDVSFIKLEDSYAIAKAVICDQSGKQISAGHKREDKTHFADFIEKSETGAIGRALALCGYGTQFASEDLDEGSRIVDAPQTPRVKAAPAPVIGEQAVISKTIGQALLERRAAEKSFVFPSGPFAGRKVSDLTDAELSDYGFTLENKIQAAGLTRASAPAPILEALNAMSDEVNKRDRARAK
jgi:hypothetical protein